MSKNPDKRTLNSAVDAMATYLASVDYAPMHYQQAMYNRAMKWVVRISDTTGMGVDEIWDQVANKAHRNPAPKPIPGKDY